MVNNNLYIKDSSNLKVTDAITLLENLLNSKRFNDVMREIENIKLSNVQ